MRIILEVVLFDCRISSLLKRSLTVTHEHTSPVLRQYYDKNLIHMMRYYTL